MKSRAAKLQPAVEQAHERCEGALLHLAEQQQLLAAGERQLAELKRYRVEYATPGEGGQSVTALLNRQSFVERIDRAIAQQTRDLARLEQALDEARGQWRLAHARESALGLVVEQHRTRERQAEDRHEQAEVDERMQHRKALR